MGANSAIHVAATPVMTSAVPIRSRHGLAMLRSCKARHAVHRHGVYTGTHRRRGKGLRSLGRHQRADHQEKRKQYASQQDHDVISYHKTWQSLIPINHYTFVTLRRRALPTTLTELSAMAAAMTGGSVEAATGVLAGVAKRYIYREKSCFNQIVTPIR